MPIDPVSRPDGSAPLVLDRAERHGEWEHRAFVDALNAHRWATLLGMRTFIRYDDVALLSRVVTVPFVLDDVSFEAGERIFLSPLAANHDPSRFPDPEVLDISRRGTEPITFGFGPHFCIGAALARMDVQAVIRMLAERFRTIERVDEAIEWTPLLEFRGPVSFRVRVPEQRRTPARSL